MKYNDLIERVKWGEEFLFRYDENEYWISQNDHGRYLTRVSDAYSQEFISTEQLFDKARINGKTILQIWKEIEDQF